MVRYGLYLAFGNAEYCVMANMMATGCCSFDEPLFHFGLKDY